MASHAKKRRKQAVQKSPARSAKSKEQREASRAAKRSRQSGRSNKPRKSSKPARISTRVGAECKIQLLECWDGSGRQRSVEVATWSTVAQGASGRASAGTHKTARRQARKRSEDAGTAQAARAAVTSQAAAKAARQLTRRVHAEQIADLLASVASAQRLRLLYKLLEGQQTYQTLQKTSQLKAGPLYFHLSALRQAGLVGPKQRNVYALTTAGARIAMMTMALAKIHRAS